MPGKITPESGHAVATVNGQTLASAASWLRCEGNVYFPPDTLKGKDEGVFSNTELMTYCPWKGHAGYYTVDVGGKKVENAGWYYADPMDAALPIKDHVAFDRSKVTVKVD
ncbi:hypothetical protein NLU13_0490 [Sarocladium strictum]|uniref:DUF427 domain-containing protein n=1 Tax=Sarocladium strictum TaxID=5046 RepID=A0AA39GQL9_SARSR|nr:hypothetical protein NLU13_0490 [Sarocladium strictum]